jgi:hypothetical protein
MTGQDSHPCSTVGKKLYFGNIRILGMVFRNGKIKKILN